MEELISVVLPVYNGSRFLEESINSIISQTYNNWELLIIDDCSTDDTPMISKRFAEKDERIFYYRNETNMKLPNTLNRGFSLSKGKLLTWTSDDNYYYPKAFEIMKKKLEKEDTDFVFASFDRVDENNNIVGEHISSKNDISKIVARNIVGACFLYTRRVYELVGDYNNDLIFVEDYDYWQRVFSNFNVSFIQEKLYAYRSHEMQISNVMKKSQYYENLIKMLIKNRSSFGKISLDNQYNYWNELYQAEICLGKRKNNNPYYAKYKKFYLYELIRYRIIGRLLKK